MSAEGIKDVLHKHCAGEAFMSVDQWTAADSLLRAFGEPLPSIKVDRRITGIPKHVGNSGVYVIEAEGTGRYKIGWSTNVSKRIKAIQTGCPFKVKLLTVLDSDEIVGAEGWLHKKLSQFNVTGEWFELSDHVLTWLYSLRPALTGQKQDA